MVARVGVVVFPGSNCEHDVAEAFAVLGAESTLLWHGSRSVDQVDIVVLPGGFAHGDYLRPGGIARFSPIMAAVGEHAAGGGAVVGICNGFQVLTEAHLLPGALQKNKGLTFLCQRAEILVASNQSVLTAGLAPGLRLSIPVNHFEGNYTASPATLDQLEAEGRVVLRYVGNPNGSARDIAGITNKAGNVVGLMPHPERASSEMLGSADGLVLLRALLSGLGR